MGHFSEANPGLTIFGKKKLRKNFIFKLWSKGILIKLHQNYSMSKIYFIN